MAMRRNVIDLSLASVRRILASNVERLDLGDGMHTDRVTMRFEQEDGSEVSLHVFGPIGMRVERLVREVPEIPAPGESQSDTPGGARVTGRPDPVLSGPGGAAL